MTLDQYLKIMHQFEGDWRNSNQQDPQNFPLEQTRADWDSAFMRFDPNHNQHHH